MAVRNAFVICLASGLGGAAVSMAMNTSDDPKPGDSPKPAASQPAAQPVNETGRDASKEPAKVPTPRPRGPFASNPPSDQPPKGPTPDDLAKLDAAKAGELERICLEIAKSYKSYGRVSGQANWAPQDCRIMPPAGVRASVSKDDATHGQKLYHLWARDPQSYTVMSYPMHGGEKETNPLNGRTSAWTNPVGTIIVKESFKPIQLTKDESEKIKSHDHPDNIARTADGATYRMGDPNGLYVMFKLDPKTKGTDQGWVYATTNPDATKVLQIGAIESCVKCHDQTKRDRLFGLPRSWTDAQKQAAGIGGEKTMPPKPERPNDAAENSANPKAPSK